VDAAVVVPEPVPAEQQSLLEEFPPQTLPGQVVAAVDRVAVVGVAAVPPMDPLRALRMEQ